MSDDFMKPNDDYDLQEEYDLSQLPVMPKGRYAPERRIGSNLIVLLNFVKLMSHHSMLQRQL